jgi:hypothetical protein
MFFFNLNPKSKTILNTNHTIQNLKTSIVLVSIFKNEGHILQEWIEHYIKEGVDLFCLIDNGSTDNYLEKIKPYIDSRKVILTIDSSKYSQTNLYNKYYLNLCKTFTWVIVVDLDEFMYSRNGYNTIKEYLNTLDNSVSRLMIPWKMFGSSGFTQQPQNVIQYFTKRQEYNNYDFQKYECTDCIKSIIRGNKLEKLDIHVSLLNDKPNEHITPFKHKTEENLHNHNIHLNHYAIQSLHFFTNVKMTRGDANSNTSENVRNMEYFQKYDHNDIIDEELKNKLYYK